MQGATFVNQRNSAQNFHLDHVTPFGNAMTDFAYVDWVIVALAAGPLVYNIGVLPSLKIRQFKAQEINLLFLKICN